MSTSIRDGVNLSKDEFHGIMAAVARRINRMAMTGHPDGPIDGQQAGPPPGTPPDNGIGQGRTLPPGQFYAPGAMEPMDDLVYRAKDRPAKFWDQKARDPNQRPNLPPPVVRGATTNI